MGVPAHDAGHAPAGALVMARCAKPGCKAEARPGKTYCHKHRGAVWNKDFHLFSAKTKPVRRPK